MSYLKEFLHNFYDCGFYFNVHIRKYNNSVIFLKYFKTVIKKRKIIKIKIKILLNFYVYKTETYFYKIFLRIINFQKNCIF